MTARIFYTDADGNTSPTPPLYLPPSPHALIELNEPAVQPLAWLPVLELRLWLAIRVGHQALRGLAQGRE